jgi:SagB-type dehydrogenase family enzyme
MRYRAAQTLVYSRAEGALIGCNFLAKSVFNCDPDLVAFLGGLSEWCTFGEIAALMGEISDEDARATLGELVNVSALVEEGSGLAKAEDEFRSGWKWGLPAAMMHFCVQNPDYMSLEESQALQREKAARGPQPKLFTRNRRRVVTELPEPRDGSELVELMARRRTVRAAGKPTITLKQLSDCLYAGMGITGHTSNGIAKLPLGMTPSGGGRNPYEAYVYASNVEGLTPGFHHYSAFDHDLGLVETNQRPKFSELVGGQDWADEMPCMILLCASLDRTMWKYDDPNGYRVVLIEAGHIGQNIMLAATRHGLTACPTAALSHSKIRECLAMEGLTDAPIYALTLCVPGEEASATRPLRAAG